MRNSICVCYTAIIDTFSHIDLMLAIYIIYFISILVNMRNQRFVFYTFNKTISPPKKNSVIASILTILHLLFLTIHLFIYNYNIFYTISKFVNEKDERIFSISDETNLNFNFSSGDFL